MSRLVAAATAFAILAAAPAVAAPKHTIMPLGSEALAFQTKFGFSDAVIHGDTVYLSGVVTGTPPAGSDPVAYYDEVFDRIGKILARAGSSWDDVLDITTFHVDIDASLAPLGEAKNHFVKAPFPTWTAIGVKRLYEPSAQVEIKVIARLKAKR